jgi:hypothetical protein
MIIPTPVSGGEVMDTTEKILRAFIFRLALLLLAVLAARHLPDHSQRAVSSTPHSLAAAFDASLDCSSQSPLGEVGLED